MSKLAFIGAGNMTKSIVAGLIKHHYSPDLITVANPSEQKRLMLADEFHINHTRCNISASRDADFIILAVKPHFIKDVCQQLAEHLDLSNTCVISVAAGITIDQIQRALGKTVPVVRCMPNTPALIGLGMTGLFASNEVTPEQKSIANQLLQSVGSVCWVDLEEQIDHLLSVSGSGPAYFFYFMEAMEQQALKLGFSKEVARQLVQQTALGAASMVVNNNEEISTLRENVTSKGGTTQAALQIFAEAHLPQIITNAMQAALHRAQEIAQNNN